MYFPYSGIYVSREANKTLCKYFNSDKSGFEIITGFQQRVLDRNLEMKHKKETDPWDEDLKQTPELPKNLVKWFDKYAICEHFIFYRYTEKKNKTGYCTYCQKEVPIENPRYKAKGVCPCCNNEIAFKSLGKVGYFLTENHQAYVLQHCKDGIMIREFDVRRIYYRGEPFAPKVHQSECRRTICDSHGHPQRAYYYGTYKQKELRWIATGIVSHYYGIYSGKIYPRTLNTLSLKELKETGLKEMYLHCGIIDPERYLSRLSEQPFIEKFVKAELFKLAEEQISEGAYRTAYSINPTAGSLAKFLCIDSQKLKELRGYDGGTEQLKWLQFEKKSGQVIDFKLKIWLLENKASPEDLSFITDKMSIRQIYNYITRQMKVSGINFNTVLNTWQDYLSMAKKLNIDTDDEIVYRTSRLQQIHAELVNELQKKDLSDRAAEIAENYPDISKVFEYVKSKYEYSEGEYSVIAPSGIVDLLTEGRNLRHCVADQERYIDRKHRRESYILFLRRTAEPDVSYYTLEVEPGGSVRQKRTLYDRQNPDIEDASCFLKKWQSVIKERLSREDIKLAETSKALRLEEFAQLDKDNIIVHGGF